MIEHLNCIERRRKRLKGLSSLNLGQLTCSLSRAEGILHNIYGIFFAQQDQLSTPKHGAFIVSNIRHLLTPLPRYSSFLFAPFLKYEEFLNILGYAVT